MGVTIHFEGKLHGVESIDAVRDIAMKFALKEGWSYTLLDASSTGDAVRHAGSVGIVLQPFPLCEPLRLEFDDQLETQGWVKTQFAHPTVHMSIVNLLRSLQGSFEVFEVSDEGQYWNTENEDVLRDQLSACFRSIDSEKMQDPNLIGPVCLRDGSILDLVGTQLLGAMLQASEQVQSPEAGPAKDRLNSWIRSIPFGDGTIEDVEFDDETCTWFTAVTIENNEGSEQTFELEFQYIDDPEYLIIRWIVLPPDEMPSELGPLRRLKELLEELNDEVGAKWCLSTDVSGERSLVSEVELPVQSLSKAMLVTALEHSIDLVGSYWSYIESSLT
ncbi:MAG: hypothetical protein K2W95_29385 [Candidatus Obscuribacterales bacterium]|nr:hypothetical protein [Candidatus Obscuribacterales bacterium]